MHDGSHLRLKKLPSDYDPTNRLAAIRLLNESRLRQEIVTGIYFVEVGSADFLERLHLVEEPLVLLPESDLRPSQGVLEEIMSELR